MMRNVGPTERYARLAVGAAAGAAATRTNGWQRATLGAIAAAGLGTGLTQYCPLNRIMGRDGLRGVEPPADAVLALAPAGWDAPMTVETDLFGSER